MAIKKELEMKIQHLETIFNEQQKEYQSSPHAFQAVGKGTHLIKTQAEMRNAIFRTCKELSQADPSLKSGMYWIDPDGQGVGDDPIYVECDMATGKRNSTFTLKNYRGPLLSQREKQLAVYIIAQECKTIFNR